ncbi:MAG TPA: glycosyltransferase family 1 protein, partial [Acidimicrobiales bacterium]|nr:glycosyltransferase family 1 protein [Acidimicrobiales bacterium]
MRIAVDGRTLQSRPLGGIGRVLRGVLPSLPAALRDAGVDLAGVDVLTDARLAAPDPCVVPADVEVHAVRTLLPGRAPAWLQWAVPRWLSSAGRARDVRLFHCPFYGLPYRQPVPMVVSLYDLTFLDHPQWFPPLTRAAFRAQARVAARTARAVITGSVAVSRQVVGQLGVGPGRVVTAPAAVDEVFLAAGRSRPPRGATAAWRRGYVVATGGAPRRNLAVAVDAWRGAREAGAEIDLVVVGPLTAAERRVASPAEGLVLAGSVSDEELARLLAGAVAFVYPTAYEGFGLPATEAAATGTPVVCAPVGALPEVLGHAAEWCDPTPSGPSVEAVAGAILRLLNDPERASRIGSAAHERMAAAPDHA